MYGRCVKANFQLTFYILNYYQLNRTLLVDVQFCSIEIEQNKSMLMESLFQDCGIEYVFIVKDLGGIVIGVQKVHVRMRVIRPSAISRKHGKRASE